MIVIVSFIVLLRRLLVPGQKSDERNRNPGLYSRKYGILFKFKSSKVYCIDPEGIAGTETNSSK